MASRSYQEFWSLGANPKPLVLMRPQFLRKKFATARMLVVVTVNFSVALEAHRNRVFYIVAAAALHRNDVVCLDFHSAETMADTATPVALRQQFGNLISFEGHGGGVLHPVFKPRSCPGFSAPVRRASRAAQEEPCSENQASPTSFR